MPIFDFHLHIYPEKDIEKEKTISMQDNMERALLGLSQRLTAANIMFGLAIILDTGFADNKKAVEKLEQLIAAEKIENLRFAGMIDFRHKKAIERLAVLKSLGFKAIKFHPRLQNIISDDYEKAKQVAIAADKNQQIIIIDTHYDGFGDEPSGLALAQEILPHIKGPVILAHSGGLRVLEAVILGLNHRNVYFDTSFSLWLWQGSALEKDFAFAFKKIGAKHCLYGSDAPYAGLKDSIDVTDNFFKKYKFPQADIDDIMYNNAHKLLGI